MIKDILNSRYPDVDKLKLIISLYDKSEVYGEIIKKYIIKEYIETNEFIPNKDMRDYLSEDDITSICYLLDNYFEDNMINEDELVRIIDSFED